MKYLKNNELIHASSDKVECCPVCDNKFGFSFGTCVECGFNYLSGEFRFIKAIVDHIPNELKEKLISIHAYKYDVITIYEKNN